MCVNGERLLDMPNMLSKSHRVKKTRTKKMIVAGMGAMLAYGTINLVNAANVETPADVAAAPS